MIPHIPDQRKSKAKGNAFGALVKYITQEGISISQEAKVQPGAKNRPEFSHLIDYATAPGTKDGTGEKCIAVRTHGIANLSTAALEMHAVAAKNPRVEDPAYHIILSWPEHEHPIPDKIFDAAEHALKALGLHEHQYVLAVHGDTDNTHCHISVNRVHPVTFKSKNIEWATKTLHLAARQSEIKHGWTHDKGIYIVEVDGHGKKHIVLNKDHSKAASGPEPRVHREFGVEEVLPTWHDPASLDSWLKKRVARELKSALPDLNGWPALHAWLDRYDIQLSDTGGGLRLHATSPESGDVLDLPVSKGLRLLKRSDLETRWGKFTPSGSIAVQIPDLSHLSHHQIQKGIDNVLSNSPDGGRPPQHVLDRNGAISRPGEHFIRPEQSPHRDAPNGSSGMHELPNGSMASHGQTGAGLLPDVVPDRLGDFPPREDPNVRRSGDSATGGGSTSIRSSRRDDSKRSERKQQRADARVDLRNRYAQYKRFVRIGDTAHFTKVRDARSELTETLKSIREQGKLAKATLRAGVAPEVRLIATEAINAEVISQRVLANAQFRATQQALRATRTPPLSWRTWLYEQSNLGDQAALSALRGIVYQAQRDAKKVTTEELEETSALPETNEYREDQFKKAMARLLKEERDEAAIRAASYALMRPHEIDSLIADHRACQWRVTGNGNVDYSDLTGRHLFTDRGNRITFDRVVVTDDDIRLALAHSRQKFGAELTLTGTSVAFTERMARLADDMGMVILNPELQGVIAENRNSRIVQLTEAPLVVIPSQPPIVAEQAQVSPNEQLRKKVLAIDPSAKFIEPTPLEHDSYHVGPIAAYTPGGGFAQHTGRGLYVLHCVDVPAHASDDTITVRYRSGVATSIVIPTVKKVSKFEAKVSQQLPGAPLLVLPERDVSTSSPETPALDKSPLVFSAFAWIDAWSAENGKPISEPVGEKVAIPYKVLFVAHDGVVVDKGRSVALYPVPSKLIIQPNDVVEVTASGELRSAIRSLEQAGKTKR